MRDEIVRQVALLICIALVSVFVACDHETPASLVASDVHAYAPLPGSTAAVAYFELQNQSGNELTIHAVRSPDFDDVAMHETVLDDGVAKMQPLTDLSIPAGGSVEFKAGGKHLMLIGGDGTAGDKVTIVIEHSGGMLELGTILRNRFEAS